MNELITQNEKMMTTKELADVLGVEVTAVKRAVQKLGAVLHSVKKNNQGGYMFTEEQATLIKQEIQKHHNLATRQIDTVTTEEEENQTIINALAILKRRADEYKQRAEIAESKVTELTPKAEFYDAVTSSSDCIEMKEVAKLLNIKDMGRNKLFEILRNKNILDRNNQPYQKYVDAGLFRIVESKYSVNGDVRINLKTVVFQKGIDFIKKIIK